MDFFWDDDTDYEMQRNIVIMKVKMRYIELGLVIPIEREFGGPSTECHQIDDALRSLSPQEQNCAKRKFRKQARKALGKKSFDKKGPQRKRSAVYSMFWRDTWVAMSKKGDPDLMGSLSDII